MSPHHDRHRALRRSPIPGRDRILAARGVNRRAGASRVGARYPALDDSSLAEGTAARRSYKLSLNGERFVSDPETPLTDGDVLACSCRPTWEADRVSPGLSSVAISESIPGLVEPSAFPWRSKFCGNSSGAWGWGPGSWPMRRRPGVDPLGLDAALVFALSPLVGSPLTTSAKFAVVAFSPLTGRVCDALSSSHFALAAKRAGLDALVVTGACEGVVDRVDRRHGSRPSASSLGAGRVAVGLAGGRGRGADPGAAWIRVAGRRDRSCRRAADPVCEFEPRRPACGPGGPRCRAGLEADQGDSRPRQPSNHGWPTRSEPSPWPGTTPACRSDQRPRSIGSWVRLPTCWRSTASRLCRPAISRRTHLKGPSV